MDYFQGIDFCNQVNGHAFVARCLDAAVIEDAKVLEELAIDYLHKRTCGDCTQSVRNALLEYRV